MLYYLQFPSGSELIISIVIWSPKGFVQFCGLVGRLHENSCLLLQETAGSTSICVHSFNDVISGKTTPAKTSDVARRAPMVYEPELGLLAVGQYRMNLLLNQTSLTCLFKAYIPFINMSGIPIIPPSHPHEHLVPI